MTVYRDKNGNQIFLGNKLGQGGEADVYSLKNKKNLVAKIYNDTHKITKQKLKKLEMMCNLYDNKIATYYAWPKEIIYSNNKAVGFIMENLNSAKSNSEYIKIINFYNSKPRKKFFPNAEYKYLVHTAQNFACAVSTLHKKNIVIGDINESNIFVNNTDATVKLIDCDSYQIEDFCADVGKPDYIAPELPNQLKGVKRTQNHDNFALAIMLFLILVGKHPYARAGISQGGYREAITQNLYCYGYNAQKKGLSALYPYSEIFNLLNKEIKELFEKAFNTLDRPSADDWIQALKKYENQLVECDYGENHWYNPQYRSCIWCDLEEAGFFNFGNTQINSPKIQHSYTINQTAYQNTTNQQQNTQAQTGINYQQQYRAGANQSNYGYFDFITFLKKLLEWLFYAILGIFTFAGSILIMFFGGFKKIPKIISSILILGFLILGSYIKNFNKNSDPQNSYVQNQTQEQQVKKEDVTTPIAQNTTNEEINTPNNTDQNTPSRYTPEEQKELDVAFNSYMKYISPTIKRYWNPPINNREYSVTVVIILAKDGRLISSKIKKSSGNQDIDNSALDALKNAAPFKPLPTIFKDNSVTVEYTFENVRKY